MAKSFSAKHLNWAHAFWGMGSSLGPAIMRQMMIFASWRAGYFVLTALAILSSLIILVSVMKNIWGKEAAANALIAKKISSEENLRDEKNNHAEIAAENSARNYLTKTRHQVMEVVMFFIYGGMEYSLGFWITTVLLTSRNVPQETVGMFPAVYYGGLMAGRLVLGQLAEKMSNTAMVRLGLAMAFSGTLLLALTHNVTAGIAAIGLAGAGFAPVFPCLMHDTASRFAPSLLLKLVGYEVAAAAGGIAILSAVKGPIMARTSLETLFPMMLALIALTFLLNEILERAMRKANAKPC
jgi:fucose permease